MGRRRSVRVEECDGTGERDSDLITGFGQNVFELSHGKPRTIGKTYRGRHYRKFRNHEIQGFGHLVTRDHVDAKDTNGILGLGGQSAMFTYYDFGTDWIGADAVKRKDELTVARSLKFVTGPGKSIKVLYSDIRSGLRAACKSSLVMRKRALRDSKGGIGQLGIPKRD